jgi:ketosteroid isomerase-like protein
MSQENVEIVRQVSDAFNRGDIEGCLAFYGEDVEIEDLMNAPDVPRVVRGIDGARELLTTWSEGFEEFRQDIVELIDLGDTVVGVSDYHGTSREGLTIQLRVADVVEIRDGKLVRVTFGYENRAKGPRSRGAVGARRSRRGLSLGELERRGTYLWARPNHLASGLRPSSYSTATCWVVGSGAGGAMQRLWKFDQ